LPGKHDFFRQSGKLSQWRADQYSSGAVYFDITSIADKQPLQTAYLRLNTRETVQFLFYWFPGRLGINQQTSGRIGCDDNISRATGNQLVPILRRDGKPALAV